MIAFAEPSDPLDRRAKAVIAGTDREIKWRDKEETLQVAQGFGWTHLEMTLNNDTDRALLERVLKMLDCGDVTVPGPGAFDEGVHGMRALADGKVQLMMGGENGQNVALLVTGEHLEAARTKLGIVNGY